MVDEMSSGKRHPLLPVELRFDISDTTAVTPSVAVRPAIAAAPSAVAAARRASPRIVQIPPRVGPPPLPACDGLGSGSVVAAAAPVAPADDGLASGSVVAVITEDAEAIRIDERRDTLEQPPLTRHEAPVAPQAISDDSTQRNKTQRDLVATRRGIPPLRKGDGLDVRSLGRPPTDPG
jgi:hypothetical protein